MQTPFSSVDIDLSFAVAEIFPLSGPREASRVAQGGQAVGRA